jgi:hypothetical protein
MLGLFNIFNVLHYSWFTLNDTDIRWQKGLYVIFETTLYFGTLSWSIVLK